MRTPGPLSNEPARKNLPGPLLIGETFQKNSKKFARKNISLCRFNHGNDDQPFTLVKAILVLLIVGVAVCIAKLLLLFCEAKYYTIAKDFHAMIDSSMNNESFTILK